MLGERYEERIIKIALDSTVTSAFIMKREGGKTMLTIGQFSKKTGVTIRTLRYYDEKGLLKPTYVSPSGRRYYEDDNMVTLQKILTFKFLGYPLEDIQSMLATSDLNLHKSLVRQKQEMLIKKAQIEKTIATLENAITLSENQEEIHTDVFLSIIHDLIHSDEQHTYFKTLLPEDLVDELEQLYKENIIDYTKHHMETTLKLKEAYRMQLPDEEVLLIVEEMLSIVPEHLLTRIIEATKQIDEGTEIDESLFHMPFTKEEEQWLERIMKKSILGGNNDE